MALAPARDHPRRGPFVFRPRLLTRSRCVTVPKRPEFARSVSDTGSRRSTAAPCRYRDRLGRSLRLWLWRRASRRSGCRWSPSCQYRSRLFEQPHRSTALDARWPGDPPRLTGIRGAFWCWHLCHVPPPRGDATYPLSAPQSGIQGIYPRKLSVAHAAPGRLSTLRERLMSAFLATCPDLESVRAHPNYLRYCNQLAEERPENVL